MKTIRQWFAETIKDIPTLKAAKKNALAYNEWILGAMVNDFSDALAGAFDWDSTKEGYDFWCDLHNELCEKGREI